MDESETEPVPAIIDHPFDPSPPPSPFIFPDVDVAADIDAFPLPSDFSPDLEFGDDLDLDLDVDFSVDDFFRPTDAADPAADPVSGDGSGVSSSSPHRSSDISHNSSPSSPVSGHSASNSPVVGNSAAVDRELKIDDDTKAIWCLKRKNEKGDDCVEECFLDSMVVGNPRSSKIRRSEEVTSSCVFSAGNDDEDKKKARLMRNRESAQLSRQRKKQYVEELEEKVKAMHSTINELNSKISFIMAENVNLRHQLGGNGAAGVVYPQPGAIAPMPFPWIPGYAVRPTGSQVPLVPIPRLKPQQLSSAPRAKKSEKNGEKKTKKVASISLLGFLLIMLFCGVLVPGVNFRYGQTTKIMDVANGIHLDRLKGRVLGVNGGGYGANNSDEVELCNGKMNFGQSNNNMVSGKSCQNEKLGPQAEANSGGSWPRPGSKTYVPKENSSETLPALLYVPRNGKRVKINGNLIIHSVLAGEKALAQEKAKQSSKVTGLALAGNLVPALPVSKTGREVDRQPNSDKYGKPTSADAPLQQWFREGMAGPILSSGMCTEVFQFDASPTPNHSSGIIRAASILARTSGVNASDNFSSTSEHPRKINNRRIKYGEAIPLNGTTLNDTSQFRSPPESSHFDEEKPASSMVVSVLADPREAGDGDGDGEGRVSPNSISRIFVVVLMDSVKYVTYSCVLPFKSSAPHLVN